jgi:hypothetical protein
VATYFNSNDLDRLIPGGQRPTDGGSDDFIHRSQIISVGFAAKSPNPSLCETCETHSGTSRRSEIRIPPVLQCAPGTPVCTLTHCDSVHTLVHTSESFPTIHIREQNPRRRWFNPSSSRLLAGYFSRLHASSETCPYYKPIHWPFGGTHPWSRMPARHHQTSLPINLRQRGWLPSQASRSRLQKR